MSGSCGCQARQYRPANLSKWAGALEVTKVMCRKFQATHTHDWPTEARLGTLQDDTHVKFLYVHRGIDVTQAGGPDHCTPPVTVTR